jgi:Ser/Thr protein kinase RdoA (MazF antagonist)
VVTRLRIPRPSYLLSQLSPREEPNAALYQVLARLAELYQLGGIRTCYRAPRTLSLNFIVTTPRGKYVFRRHHLSEADVAYEYQVLDYLQQRGFPAPRMLTNQAGQAWSAIDGSLYSAYEFVAGYCPTNFFWWPSARREMIAQCGRTLAEYHQAVADLVPSAYKWNGYRPTEHTRWREGDWFRQVLKDIRSLLQKPTATSLLDDFVRSRIDALDKMLRLESGVEERSDLSKLVIHGDYAPWNVLFRPEQSPFVLDFNESRLDLKIYDVMLAIFWFAWRGDHLDQDRALAFQAGYSESGQLSEADSNLAGSVFQWIMARSLIERLYLHYLRQQRVWTTGPAGMEKQYKMCVFAQQQPQQLVAGLEGITRGK